MKRSRLITAGRFKLPYIPKIAALRSYLNEKVRKTTPISMHPARYLGVRDLVEISFDLGNI